MKPGDLVFSECFTFRGEGFGLIIEIEESNYIGGNYRDEYLTVLYESGRICKKNVGFYRNYYEVIS